LTGLTVCVFGIIVVSSMLCVIEVARLASPGEEAPSTKSGTTTGSMYHSGWVKTFIFLIFRTPAVAEAAGAKAVVFFLP
jgi:hypothetical protein